MAAFKICAFLGILLTNIAADLVVEDLFSQKLKNISTMATDQQSATGYKSPYGYIRHWSGRRFINNNGLWLYPKDAGDLIIHNTVKPDGRSFFRFEQVEGHFGYIVHSSSQKVLHPIKNIAKPPDRSKLILKQARNAGALFYVDEENMFIYHRGGGVISPCYNELAPYNYDRICIRNGPTDGRRFEFVDANFKPFSIYPTPSLGGRWERLFAVLHPAADEYKYTINYKVGKSVSRSTTTVSSWKVSASVAILWFQYSKEHSQSVTSTESSTWNEEIARQLNITVKPGATLVVWQYVFEANQFGDGLRFRSTIIGNTKDINTRPPII